VPQTSSYPEGSIIHASATPSPGYAFLYWTENNVPVSTSPVYQFSVYSDKDLTAHFELTDASQNTGQDTGQNTGTNQNADTTLNQGAGGESQDKDKLKQLKDLEKQIKEIIKLIDQLRAQIAALLSSRSASASPNTLSLTPADIVFSQSFDNDAVHEDIRHLQRFLNANSFVVSDAGPGSPGRETNIFGSLTQKALARFQQAYKQYILSPLGLSQGTGLFGASTRNFINSLK